MIFDGMHDVNTVPLHVALRVSTVREWVALWKYAFNYRPPWCDPVSPLRTESVRNAVLRSNGMEERRCDLSLMPKR